MENFHTTNTFVNISFGFATKADSYPLILVV